MSTELFITGIFLVALLYSSVGHGGASGYLALMALCGFEPLLMRQEALVLNVFVAGTAFFMFKRSGNFNRRTLALFATTSVPAAYLGSQWKIDPLIYRIILGICLLIAVGRILYKPAETSQPLKKVPVTAALLIGTVLGLLSGMIGIGGGIILSPLLIIFRWSTVKESSGIAALFILLNSLSGLAGLITKGFIPDSRSIVYIAVALAGGLAGSYLGSHRIQPAKLRYILGGVLCFAAIKLIFL
jgi:uncharacterized membrane protein YfcA